MNYLIEPTEYELEIKKSKFITYLFPVDSEIEAKQLLSTIKKQHPKANHHCSAMIIDEVVRSSDDGEPASTAGLPMLQTLQGEEMNHLLAITVRYFGGTKLGKGGLIRAYSQSVSEALKYATYYVEKKISLYLVTTDFSLMHVIESKAESIIHRDFGEKATFTLEVYDPTILDELVELTAGSVQITHLEDVLRLIPKVTGQ